MIAPDPLDTRPPLTKGGKTTYETIAARLATLNPKVLLKEHIAANDNKFPGDDPNRIFSTLVAKESTLDGVNFIVNDSDALIALLDSSTDGDGLKAMASMKEDPDHWALKASFAATVGTGYREVWRAPKYAPPGGTLAESFKPDLMRFGTAGGRIDFTALHCAVDTISKKCNIHIDAAGFVLGLPRGVSLTPDLYGHIVNELKLKTDFRNWLVGKTDNKTAKRAIAEVIRRISFNFPSAANGYAGLDKKINGIQGGRDPLYCGVTALKILAPTGLTFDAYENDKFKVQVHGTAQSGDRSVTLTIGGTW